MFVVHALVLTFLTTPLVLAFYPEKYRDHMTTAWERPKDHGGEGGPEKHVSSKDTKTKFCIVLDKIEQLSAAMTLTQLLQLPIFNSLSSEKVADSIAVNALPESLTSYPKTSIEALRLIELTARTSAVLKSQAADELLQSDPVVSVFRTFGYLNRLPVSGALSVVSHNEFANSIASHAREAGSEMVILPCTRTIPTHLEGQGRSTTPSHHNPFEGIFRQALSQDEASSPLYSDYIRKVFTSAPCDVALFLDRAVSTARSSYATTNQHLFLPFFGGP